MKYRLRDVCTKITSGGTPKSTNSTYYSGHIPWLRTQEINFADIVQTELHITEEGLNNSSAKWIPANSVIVAMYGVTAGKSAINKIPLTTNQACCNLIVDYSKADFQYVYYQLKLDYEKIAGLANGGAQQNLNVRIISDYEIDLPDLSTQRAIAKTLSIIDDKIVNNTKINHNLEQIAQAIFESWFVDFEPWSGVQPSDWEKATLGKFVDIKRGGSPRPIQEFISDRGFRWLKISDVTALQTPFVLEIKEHIKKEGLRKTVFLKAGSLVLSNSATPGIPKILCVDTCIHDGWLYFPYSLFSKEYLYLFFKHIRQNLITLGNGSIFTNLKTDILKNYGLIVPDKQTLQKFDDIVEPLFKTMEKYTRESAYLTDLRDTLLPRLMSGELSTDVRH